MPRLLFATDLDKTLLDDRAEVPQACLEAIRRYVEQGGAFTVATGRPTRGVLIYPELMALVNLPIITYNGACIYDTVAKRTVWRRLLPESFAPLVREVLERFPRTGALVFHREDDETCVIRPDPYTYEITWVREHYDAPVRDLDEISLPWNKVVIAGPPEDVEACAAYVRAHTPAPVTVILSEGTFLELTGPDVGKGKALRRVAELAGVDQAHTIAIGDSMNDMEMLCWAGLGVAVANAEPAVLQAADMVVASHVDHGVRDCIRDVALPALSNGWMPGR